MPQSDTKIYSLLDYVEVNASSVKYHFKCQKSGKTAVSELAFEPYDGKIVITLKDLLLHPIKSYKRYYHTPIVIYSKTEQKALLQKAYLNISDYFKC